MLTLELRLILETPLDSFARDARGRASIAATTLKGLHRSMTEQVAVALKLPICNAPITTQMCHPITGKPACAICRIFGSPWLPGRVRYRSLIATTTPIVETRFRTPISRRRRIRLAEQKTQHEVLPSGTTFSGQIDHRINDPALLGLALAGLRSITSLGAGGSLGYGLCRVEARALDASKHPVNNVDLAAALRQMVRLQP